MAFTTINKSSEHFNTVLYTGNGASTHAITGVGFQPDWNWHKIRNDTDWHMVNDAVRGANYAIYPNANNAEGNVPTGLKSFDSDGFTVGSLNDSNQNNGTFVSWNWKANGTGSANTDGSINSTVSVNATSAFSIVSYTGTGANATVGHGLGVAPSFVIIKDRDNAISWVVSGDNIGWNKNMYLDSTQAVQTANHFQDTAPTNSLMYLSTDAAVNGSSRNYIMYCFAEKQGYSKFGSYAGNGNNDGSFIYTGFSTAFVMTKNIGATENWAIWDNKRIPFNANTTILRADSANAETSGYSVDFVSNGFKLRGGDGKINGTGASYIYMAFAEAPLVGTNNIPANAR